MLANQILNLMLSMTNRFFDEVPLPLAYQTPVFQKPESVLLIPSLFIGDNVLLNPCIRNLRRNLGKNARIDVMSPPAVYPLYETMPWVNHVYVEKKHRPNHPTDFLRAHGYDTILFFRYSLFWSNAAQRVGISQRVGFDFERIGLHGFKHWGQRLTHAIPSRSLHDPRNQCEVYLDILRHLNLPILDKHLEPHLTQSDYQFAEHLLQHAAKDRPRILIHAACGSPGKQWPAENWNRLLSLLDRRWQPTFIASGSAKEATVYQKWVKQFDFLNLCGKTTLRQTIAVLQKTDLVITLDTSIAHLAALAGTPRLVVLYGPTNQAQWRPCVRAETHLEQVCLELPCRPCPARTCGHKSCLKQLPVAQVMQAIQRCFKYRCFQ